MKTKILITILSSLMSMPVFAQNQFEDVATLISATPNIKENAGFHQECSEQQIQSSSKSKTNASGAIVGAVVGGLLGNTIGGGNGRKVAIGVGSATGAIVGGNSGDIDLTPQVQRSCRNVQNAAVIQGYVIVYLYAGRQLTAIANREPVTDANGNFKIRVATAF